MNRYLTTGRKTKLAALAMLSGITLASACSAVDVRHNVIAGTMDFIAGYTEDLLAALFPAPDKLLGNEEG